MLRGLVVLGFVAAFAAGVSLLALVIASAVPSKTPTSAKEEAGCVRVQDPAPKPDGGRKPPKTRLDAKKRHDLTFTTNCGSFTISLNVRVSPRTTASFATLARTGFFDRTNFHRIVPRFVIQGGDPTGTGTGGPGYKTVDRPPRTTVYRQYLVAMAKTAAEPPGTAGSQFFIVTGPNVQLPPDYAVLGTVTVGRKVVDQIGRLGDPGSELPTRPIVISKVSVRSRKPA
jgi:peptidyl-prolyl cis-trans isomerase B (cyclophilin B)